MVFRHCMNTSLCNLRFLKGMCVLMLLFGCAMLWVQLEIPHLTYGSTGRILRDPIGSLGRTQPFSKGRKEMIQPHSFDTTDSIQTSLQSAVTGKMKNPATSLRLADTDSQPVDVCVRTFEEDVVHVAIFGNRLLFDPILTLATSIVMNTRSDVMFHFVTLPSDAENLRERIETGALRNTSYEIIPFNTDRVKGHYLNRTPRKDLSHPLNFARFFLPELLPCVGRVIYIDADCLVVGDIRELYDFTIEDDHVIAAMDQATVNSYYTSFEKLFNFSELHFAKLGVSRNAPIFNNGVFVADLIKWKQHNITEQLHYWSSLNVRYPVLRPTACAGSQAVMNLVLVNKFTPLPLEWNAMFYYQPGRDSKVKKLIHSAGPKLWEGHGPRALIKEWKKYLELSKSTG